MPWPPWPVLAPRKDASQIGPPSQAGRFSVVVAAYQAAGTVLESVRSALEQTAPPLEVVVCDDGSTDGTADLLADLDGRVRVLRQPNRGEAAAKNAAVNAARAEYVVVLDADDVFQPRRLEALAWLAAERPDLDVLCTDALLEVDGGVVGNAYRHDWPFPIEDQRTAILANNFVLGQAAVRRDRWCAVGGFDETLHHAADWDFFLRLVLSGSRVGLVDVPLARYRLSAGTLSSDRERLVAARIEVLRRALHRTDLANHERRVAEHALAEQLTLHRVRSARTALVNADPGARGIAFRALMRAGVSSPVRAGLAAATVAPQWAGRRWRRRMTGSEFAGGVVVPADGHAPRTAVDDPDGYDDDQSICWLRGAALMPRLTPLHIRPDAASVVESRDVHVYGVVDDPTTLSGSAADDPADIIAARLRRDGVAPRWAGPVLMPDHRTLVATARLAGSRSVAAVRNEPSLLPFARLGSWSRGAWHQRATRRVAIHLPEALPLPAGAREDVSFWRGVRTASSQQEWARWTRSYVAIAYHRVAGELRPGQERYDVSPHRFARQMSWLRRLGWRPLAPDDLIAAHDGRADIPARRVVVTLDDGYDDAVKAATRHASWLPHLYVPTAEVGTQPEWADGLRLASWAELATATASGVLIGSHARRHHPLPEHSDDRLREELTGARADLDTHAERALSILAYPNGRFDARVRRQAIAAGYTAAWTTQPGRNSVGTDPWSLRRVSVKDWDGPASFLWKVITGEPPPWEALTIRLWSWRRRAGLR